MPFCGGKGSGMSLFIIEGIDGSGKSTQIALLSERLQSEGFDVKTVKFPNYSDRSSEPVKMYLEGELGADPSAVNAYAVSAFYAVDRFISYKKLWEKEYASGKIILSDRYTMSNYVYQGSKLKPEDRKAYIEWLYDFEFGKMGIPQPDRTFYLDVPPDYSIRQVEKRYQGDESKKDIHEQNLDYLHRCYQAGQEVFSATGAVMIECVRNGKMLPPEAIHEMIYNHIKQVIDG